MIRKLFIIILLGLVVAVYAKIFVPAGKPRKLNDQERQDSIERKKPIGKG